MWPKTNNSPGPVFGGQVNVTNRATEQHITTTSEVWRIGKNGYVNVYPDQHVRQGRLSKRLIFAKKAKAR